MFKPRFLHSLVRFNNVCVYAYGFVSMAFILLGQDLCFNDLKLPEDVSVHFAQIITLVGVLGLLAFLLERKINGYTLKADNQEQDIFGSFSYFYCGWMNVLALLLVLASPFFASETFAWGLVLSSLPIFIALNVILHGFNIYLVNIEVDHRLFLSVSAMLLGCIIILIPVAAILFKLI